MKERCLFCPCGEILEQIAGTSSLVTLSVYLQKKLLDRQWSETFPELCPPSLIFFSILLSQTIYVSLTPKPRQFIWLLLAPVAIPIINQ